MHRRRRAPGLLDRLTVVGPAGPAAPPANHPDGPGRNTASGSTKALTARGQARTSFMRSVDGTRGGKLTRPRRRAGIGAADRTGPPWGPKPVHASPPPTQRTARRTRGHARRTARLRRTLLSRRPRSSHCPFDARSPVVAQPGAAAGTASDPGRSALVRPTARAAPGSLCGCGRRTEGPGPVALRGGAAPSRAEVPHRDRPRPAPGVMTRPSAWPDPATSGGTRRCDGWCPLVGCRHDRDPEPDAPRRLRAAHGR